MHKPLSLQARCHWPFVFFLWVNRWNRKCFRKLLADFLLYLQMTSDPTLLMLSYNLRIFFFLFVSLSLEFSHCAVHFVRRVYVLLKAGGRHFCGYDHGEYRSINSEGGRKGNSFSRRSFVFSPFVTPVEFVPLRMWFFVFLMKITTEAHFRSSGSPPIYSLLVCIFLTICFSPRILPLSARQVENHASKVWSV